MRWILCGAGLLLASILVALCYRHTHEPISRISLSDGTELRLEYVTYGTEHRIPGAGQLRSWLSRITERWERLNLPSLQSEYVTGTAVPASVLWFTHFDPRTGKFLPNVEEALRKVEVTGAAELNGSLESRSSNLDPMPNAQIAVQRYDRRQTSIRLRLTVPEKIEIDIPNPLAGTKFAEWKPSLSRKPAASAPSI
jgi:hypothetical protein